MTNTFLIIAAFLSSTLTAVIGVGGGMLLISVMAVSMPPVAIVPVHGVAQLASNASRGIFALKEISWQIVWPFLCGCLLGSLFGSNLLIRFPSEFLPIPLGIFILIMTWLPQWEKNFRLPGRFFGLGFVQAVLTLFVGATGPLNMPILLREGLSKDQIVVTASALMTLVHLAKIITFGFIGFAFASYLQLMVGMVIAVIAGSFVGTKLRSKIPEQLFKNIFKLLITVLALRMIIRALL
ncbi:sulfite exporter TauE/SafE family protein [Malonomonas rubra]|uniref:sulfite exporter TauE/SafE family protein n=1 Tax=Malonomonas rubra TaxID=57040 RepID=UPI0026ECC620|nr:sulfite exporter TauE/SafE family protein [Malonomonas rubra]